MTWSDYLVRSLSDLAAFKALLSKLNPLPHTRQSYTITEKEWKAMNYDEDLARAFTYSDESAITESFVQSKAPAIKKLTDFWLNELAMNSWTEWSDEALSVFLFLDEELWIESNRNPRQFIEQLPERTIDRAIKNPVFLRLLSNAVNAYKSYMADKDTIVHINYPELADVNITIFFNGIWNRPVKDLWRRFGNTLWRSYKRSKRRRFKFHRTGLVIPKRLL